MSYLEKIIMPDEQLAYAGVLHWIIFIPGLFLTLLGGGLGYESHALAGFFSEFILNPYIFNKVISGVALVIALLGLGMLIGATIKQSTTELAVTNLRLVAKYGFISCSTFEIMINRVTGVNFDQTVMGRILGYGTVLVHGAGGDISPFEGLAHPQEFQRSLLEAVEHEKR